ncbi:Peroxidase 57 [Vitis vinifera]|uniref:Peroxidase n=1 Tax=Vitis vinifera TaxID=29760 RepID=A0A438HQJ1_VITVI|nr:Peroxidase 57 [Vitis vinifera]
MSLPIQHIQGKEKQMPVVKELFLQAHQPTSIRLTCQLPKQYVSHYVFNRHPTLQENEDVCSSCSRFLPCSCKLRQSGPWRLQEGFYKGKCNVDVEKIVSNIITPLVGQKPWITPALLRMQFHDCFVKGCDASILLDGSSSEKTAPPNLSVRGYDVIDLVKAAIEKMCPGVSKEGGGHTVGVTHCSLFKDRLYNFNNTGRPDPTMQLSLAFFLRLRCPQSSTVDNTVNLDQEEFFKLIKHWRSSADQRHSEHSSLAPNDYFLTKFQQAMVKLGAVEVLTDAQGEIRKYAEPLIFNHQ